jgi:cell fate regulator YaaT (PSP1 superfamily)
MKDQFFFVKVLGDTNRYLVKLGNHTFHYGKQVIIKTEFGEDLGYIHSFLFDQKPEGKFFDSGALIRYATREDLSLLEEKQAESNQIRKRVKVLVEELGLNMSITHILLPLNGESMGIFFLAPDRVDFRELLKRLRLEWRYKNILRQITTKQRAEIFQEDPRIPLSIG